MAIDKVGGVVTDNLSSNIRIDTNKDKNVAAQLKTTKTNDKNIDTQAEDVVDVVQIKWPPMLPLGDTQSIYKIKQ
jgi:hypothetical protein